MVYAACLGVVSATFSFMYKVILETVDGTPIIPGTAKTKVDASCSKLPSEGNTIFIFYLNEPSYSMGTHLDTLNVRSEDGTFFFSDTKGIKYKLTIIDDDADL